MRSSHSGKDGRSNNDLSVVIQSFMKAVTMNPMRTEAIKRFLMLKTHADLASLYNHDMEVQVNVARDGGKRIEQGEFKGREWNAFTDGNTIWKPFRIPLQANSDPIYNDSPMTFPLELHAEGIGMTGWDWKNRVSRWVAFDFDAIMGHSDKHSKKLDDRELAEVQQAVANVPFVTLRKSTSGKGLHLYVFLDPVSTANHNEHAALARAILSMLSGLTGFDFSNKVDVCGGNMWVWHRKMYFKGADDKPVQGDGLKLIKQGAILTSIPANWRDHVNVVSRKARKSVPSFVYDLDANDPDRLFGELTGQRTRITLDPEHRGLIDYLANNGCVWWWDADNHMLVTHTIHLREAHRELRFRGTFETLATGSDRGFDHNCFAFPLRCGSWVVRRYSLGTKEHESWDQDGNGWTRCFYNREPDLHSLARLHDGVEHEKGGYAFRHAESVVKVLTALGVAIELPNFIMSRKAYIKPVSKENKLIVHIDAEGGDDGTKMKGWLNEKKLWKRVFKANFPHNPESEAGENYDDLVRHIVSTGDQDAGWVIHREKAWVEEPLVHIRLALGSLGHDMKEINQIVGTSVLKAWTLVNKPFQPEYPGNREWNRGAAQFAVTPTADVDNLSYPTWSKILEHCGSGLNQAVQNHEWCKANGITKGSEFLMLWIASMFKRPDQPSTYLAFWGSQDCGKSIFHEAISEILVTGGVVRADNALQSQQNFNGELANAILCVVEETDLRKDRTAYNRIKDWVTSPQIMIRALYTQGYMVRNTTHWIQCSNDQEACPIFEGDTRITLINVPDLSKKDMIPKPQLMQLLRKEAPDFLAAVLAMELPESDSRLAVPTIDTEGKKRAAEKNLSLLEMFMKEMCAEVPGHCISAADFYEQMQGWLEERDRHYWTKQRIGRELPERIPRGRLSNNQHTHYGNLSFDKEAKPGVPYVSKGLFIKQEQGNAEDHRSGPPEGTGQG